ncbi:MAG: RHS repeat-associated core domain-containing protein [Acidobacteriota bacterium]|nr:RHS repeat-associated core domain-containing protein [Acidobacteriota bacterium]
MSPAEHPASLNARGTLASFSCDFTGNGFTPQTSWALDSDGHQVTEYALSGPAYTSGSAVYSSTWQHTNVWAGGQLLATYYGADTLFALNDWLDTKRGEAGASGCLSLFTSLPFGNGFTQPSTANPCPDATEHHFTCKERDSESGNDYFGARYYASSMGRFLTPDPAGIRAVKLANPQTWNWYAYTLNNPLQYTDPTGKYTCADDGNKCQTQRDKDFEVARQRDLQSKDKGIAAAAAAYGDPTKDNRVGVQFTDAKKGNTAASINIRDGKVTYGITVSIPTGASGTALDGIVDHEGTHVEQDAAFAQSVKPNGSFDQTLNLTQYDRENQAYQNQAKVWQLSGTPWDMTGTSVFGIGSVIYPSFSQDQVNNMINDFLTDPGNGYGVTLQNPGPRIVTPKDQQ